MKETTVPIAKECFILFNPPQDGYLWGCSWISATFLALRPHPVVVIKSAIFVLKYESWGSYTLAAGGFETYANRVT